MKAAPTNAAPPMTSHKLCRLMKYDMSPRLSLAKAPVLDSMTSPMTSKLTIERIRT
jgi:hypothetical protein